MRGLFLVKISTFSICNAVYISRKNIFFFVINKSCFTKTNTDIPSYYILYDIRLKIAHTKGCGKLQKIDMILMIKSVKC